MHETDLGFFKDLLLDRKKQIIKNITDAKNEMNELQASVASDEADFATISADKMIEQAITAQQARELDEIDEALKKIANSTYGICVMCEEEIGIQRLKVKPHAQYCIVCREIMEKNIR